MLVNKTQDIGFANIFHNLSDYFDIKSGYIKYEGLNIAGSIKLKTAHYLISALESEFNINPQNNTIIESSSGNLGIALSIICKSKGYKFICITDPNTLAYAEYYMKLYGAEIVKVTERDEPRGFLDTRIKRIKQMLESDSGLIWSNQYASSYNINAHYETTAKEIYEFMPDLDYLFKGVGNITIVGCAKY